jgi:hypothetical protein
MIVLQFNYVIILHDRSEKLMSYKLNKEGTQTHLVKFKLKVENI